MVQTDKKKGTGHKGVLARFFSACTYYALLFFVGMLSLLPFGMLYVLSDLLFYPFYYLVRYRRATVRKNLTECFPEKSKEEIIRLEKDFYHFFVDMIFETCKLLTIGPKEMKRRMKVTNVELVNSELRRGESVSLYLGHYGNWEWLSSLGLTLDEHAEKAQIYHTLSNRAMDRLMKRLRERMGNRCVSMRQTARYMAASLRDDRPRIIGFIADHSPRKRECTYFIPFLHHSTPVLTGTEKATKHFGYRAYYVHMDRVRRGYYECTFSVLHDDPCKLPDFALTDRYFQWLEQDIRRHPELYLWTHNRFRYATSYKEDESCC